MATLNLKIVTPEKEIFDSEVEEVTLTTPEGEIGILPHHINLMTQVIPGELRIKEKGKEVIMATGGGLLQVSNNTVVIACDLVERAEDIDEKTVEEARKRAQTALEQKLTDEEYAMTVANLEKALVQLRVKRKHRVR